MRVIVVYDSSYGNTEKIALAICSGMKEVGLSDVVCKRADATAPEDFKQADAWVVGSPTHIGGPTGEAKKALKIASRSGAKGKKGASFDTRMANASKGAAEKLESMMEGKGIVILQKGEGFIVTGMKGPLVDGEEAKAVSFGRRIAGSHRI